MNPRIQQRIRARDSQNGVSANGREDVPGGSHNDPPAGEPVRAGTRGRDQAPSGAAGGEYQPPPSAAGGEYQPPVSLPPLVIGEALARQWKLILLLTVIGALAGAAVGFSRPAVYTSESELNVGSLNAQAQAIPGYAEASQTLAEAYARAVQTNQIQAPVARRTHLPLSTVQTSLTAANIPGNPIFRIDGTGPTAATAQAVATAATREIVRYAHKRTSPPGAVAALNGYTQATVLANQLSSKAGRLKARFGSNPTPAQQATLALVQRAAAAAQLQAGAQQQSYVNAVGNQTTAGSVTLLNPAGLATSNRSRIAEIAGFAGAIVGCLIGCALAIRVAARRRRQLIQALMADYETVI